MAVPMTAAAHPARAEVISILHGTFTVSSDVPQLLNITGNRGFKVDAGAQNVFFLPDLECRPGGCAPGQVVGLDGNSGGGDLPATVTPRGKTYRNVGSNSSPSSLMIEFSGQVTVLPLSDKPVSITVPFDFSGLFAYAPDFESGQQQAFLIGGGFVTLHFVPSVEAGLWEFRRADFEFRPAQR